MKTFTFPYYPYEKEDILSFLNQKAKEGYLLVSVNFKDQYATFQSTNKKDICYDLTIHQDSNDAFEQYNQNIQEYYDSCALSGWQHLCSCDGVRFFYGTNDAVPLADPYTDQLSIVDKKKEFRYYLMKKVKSSIFLVFIALTSILLTNTLDLFDIYILSSGVFIIFIFLSMYYSNNINFRLNGVELMVALIMGTALIATFQNISITILCIILCILIFAYLTKVKYPPFLYSLFLDGFVKILLVSFFIIYIFS